MCSELNKLDELKKITPRLPIITTLKDFTSSEGYGFKHYSIRGGTAESLNIYNDDDDISIAKTFIPGRTEFIPHIHRASYEILIVLEGKLKVEVDGNSIDLAKHSSIKIEKESVHAAYAETDTTIIVATIPKDEGFPE